MHLIARNWRLAPLTPANQALCAYAEKLTLTPQTMLDQDVQTLRDHQFDDRAIHDVTQIISFFNYINRVADALDVELEDFVLPWGEIELELL